MAARTIFFDSDDLPGDARLRKERWVDSLCSGYVRLQADAKPDPAFDGKLRIMLLGQTAIGRISGTVQSIARTPTEIAVENTDNAVLLLNASPADMLVEQKGRSIACTAGAAVLIEQCEPSAIKVSPRHNCDFMAIQLPRHHIRRHNENFETRFMRAIPAASSALALTHAYVDTLLRRSDAPGALIPRFAADHIADLVAAAIDPDALCRSEQSLPLRAARFETIRREIDRHFMVPGFSLTALARRIGVSPRYIQALFAEAETSFTDEVTKRRLERAYEMLASPRFAHLTVMDVAHECGFPTVSHFHRIFRRQFNATPGEIRNEPRR